MPVATRAQQAPQAAVGGVAQLGPASPPPRPHQRAAEPALHQPPADASGSVCPLAALGVDLFYEVLSHLGDAETLQAAERVSRGWRAAIADGRLWRPLCEAAWAACVYSPAAARPDLTWRQRHALTLADRQRATLTADELCTFTWLFRFKSEAGRFWLALDPWWVGLPQLRRFFHADGSLTAAPEDPLWGEHETRWRFCKTRHGVKGLYVKVNHWPSLTVSRTPAGGWQLENEWVVYAAALQPGGPYARGLLPGVASHQE
ncbi:F-box family isoform B [Micractinium conductrix]|uniref:F-box family isoform B n=1 Tax=Micractinium conductrix TaxID=554055 RepID=A0A2P6VMI6_9CHLO|nr:F-box family isoform B [Micractinium conductrix]|eukprot:PSC75299.1 F-box family isoform B [Micractinium conductrix]